MTGRKASMIANKIYAAMGKGQISAYEALNMIDKLEPYFTSIIQMHKSLDLAYYVEQNFEDSKIAKPMKF